MAVRTRTRKPPDTYFRLVRRFPLTVIADDAHLERAILLIDELLDLPARDGGEQAYLDALTTLVESYEAEHVAMPCVDGRAVLRNLLADNGITQAELARDAGIAESALSEVLAGKRRLSRSHIGKLARFFNIDPGAFMADW
ncbi:MAG TPA: helix-turn-helix domain-containing protein [Gemmataceae bacterium]|nr:helix-turn-helix domain-containing protein [Gemmataceae bacterium]